MAKFGLICLASFSFLTAEAFSAFWLNPQFTSTDKGPFAGQEALAVGDLNGDTKPDLAIQNYRGGDGPPGNIALRFGTSTGIGAPVLFTEPPNGFGGLVDPRATFQLRYWAYDEYHCPPWLYPCPQLGPSDIAMADLDRDGDDEMVVDGHTSMNILNYRSGGFEKWQNYDAGRFVRRMIVADVTQDHYPDVIAIGEEQLMVFANDRTGKLLPPVLHHILPDETDSPASLVSTDLNHDGAVDIVVGSTVTKYRGFMLSVLLGNKETGDLDPATIYRLQTPSNNAWLRSIAVGDFQHDGNPDIIAIRNNGGNYYVLPGKGDGTFFPTDLKENTFPSNLQSIHHPSSTYSKEQVIPNDVQHKFVVQDINGDHKDDITLALFSWDGVGNALKEASGMLVSCFGRNDLSFKCSSPMRIPLDSTRAAGTGLPLGAVASIDFGDSDYPSFVVPTASGGFVVARNESTPDLSIDTSILDFPDIPPTGTSAPKRVVISNGGNMTSRIFGVGIVGDHDGDFEVTNETCSGLHSEKRDKWLLFPEEQCTVEVIFSPKARGKRTAILEILTNALTTPGDVRTGKRTVRLSGVAN